MRRHIREDSATSSQRAWVYKTVTVGQSSAVVVLSREQSALVRLKTRIFDSIEMARRSAEGSRWIHCKPRTMQGSPRAYCCHGMDGGSPDTRGVRIWFFRQHPSASLSAKLDQTNMNVRLIRASRADRDFIHAQNARNPQFRRRRLLC